MLNLEDSVGIKVKIVTNDNEPVEGVIHSYSPKSGIVSIIDDSSASNKQRSGGYSEKSNLVVMKSSFIKSVTALSKSKIAFPQGAKIDDKFRAMYNQPAKVPIPSIGENFRRGDSKASAHQELEFNRRRIFGDRHISVEGKAVFDQLYDLLPEGDVTFDNADNIRIFGNHLVVGKPYTPENCGILNGNGETEDQQLSYIRKVIKDIWNKLETERKGG